MGNIGILTTHAAHNYGAVLQAYALKNILHKLGYSCKLVNYQSNELRSKYSILDRKSLDLNAFIKFSQNCFNIRQLKKRRDLFNDFINTYLDGNDECLATVNEVQKAVTGYDVIIVGSDQVWNVKLNDVRYNYLLDFPKQERRISYAASFGNNLESLQENLERILPLISNFDSVSMREKDASDFLHQYGVQTATVLDPTFLLEKEEWSQIGGQVQHGEPYILYYSLGCRKYTQAVTKSLARQLGLKVVCPVLHPRAIGSGFYKEIACGPERFLSLIQSASFICTDSFHGTVFSIIFEKPFVSIFDCKDGKMVRENRKASLLEQLGLEKHMVTQKMNLDARNFMQTDHSDAYDKKIILKSTSMDFLKKSLKGV